MKNENYGSLWRKWNLHLHSKYSGESTTKMEIREIFEIAIKKEISMISITDHSNIDGLDEIWDTYENGTVNYNDETKKIKDLIDFLPGIELCTDKGKSGIHIIVVFPKEITINGILVKTNVTNLKENFCNKIGLTKAKIEAQGKGNYNDGLLNIKVNFDETINIARELGGKIIIHGGDKHKSIENEMSHEKDHNSPLEVYKNLGLQKEDIIKYKIDLIELPNINTNNSKNIDFYHKNFNKPCIISSDSHTKDQYESDLQNKSSWIKADLSFDGFNQALIDYQERICLLEIPEQLKNFNENRTKYIENINITWTDSYKGSFGTWFKDVNIPLNYGLVSIIGNKGSGKTAIAEIIAFICNTKKYEDFNFLTPKRFKLKNLASNFDATLSFYDEIRKSTKNLGENNISGALEEVQFIPQNYFEKICNTTQSDQFSKELNRVVFSKMKEEDQENANSFEELIEKYKVSANKNISYQKSRLSEINSKIITLEKKQKDSYILEISNNILKYESEKIELNKNKPKVIELPKMSKIEKNLYIENREKIESIDKIISTENTKLIETKTKYNEINYIKTEINNLVTRFETEMNHFDEKLKTYGINFYDLVDVKINLTSIDKNVNELSRELKKIQESLAKNNELKAKAKKEIDKITENSQTSIKKYEKYQIELKEWNEKEQKNTNMLNYYKAEHEYIENKLLNEINDLDSERLSISRTIYLEKTKLINLFDKFKEPIDKLIDENNELLSDYNLQIKSGHFIKDTFETNFFEFINKNKKNAFRDTNYTIISKLNNEFDINDIESSINLISYIMNEFKNYKESFIHDQIKEKRLEEFYEYLYSFDFLEEKYNLLTFDKTLESLSPGERGALLLVFYLLIDDSDIPLILDQPEDNLDNQSISSMLVPFIKKARKHRQIIIVTHNPNISVVSDSDQIIYININKNENNNVYYECGAIENSIIKDKIVEIQEGTKNSFIKREKKYNIK